MSAVESQQKEKWKDMRKIIYPVQGILQAFIGLGAAISGALMILSPGGTLMKMPLTLLDGSPFRSFLIPGIILCVVIGMGHCAAAMLTFRRNAVSGYAGIVTGLGLAIWIFVQVSMIGGGHWLQNLYFGLAIAEISLASLLTRRNAA